MPRQARLRHQIIAITAARTLINTGYRMVYPFLPAFARGLGVDVEAIALAITARSALGLLSPAFGTIADWKGRKAALLIGLGVATGGLLVIAGWPVYAAFFAGLLGLSAGKITFDTAMQAYIGDRVDYARRGQAIGITELSWSLAFFVGMPIAGWLIARSGWHTPFIWLAVLLAGSGLLLWRILTPDGGRGGGVPPLPQAVRTIARRPAALAGLLVSLLISGGNEVVSIVFGLWMEGAFGLQIAALGAASIVIGAAELAGEGAVIGLVDRLGKRRAAALGLAGSVLSGLALPTLGTTVPGALVGLFLFYLTFEFTLVTMIALMTEIAPDARATLMAGNAAFQSIGRALGAPLGTALFAGGILANGTATALMNGLALALLLLFIPRGD